jgi:hypothetical protein
MKTKKHLFKLSAFFLILSGCAHRVNAQGARSNHSQNIKTNNGISVQVNVEQSLRKSAANAQIDERGWMRLLTPSGEESPQNACATIEKNVANDLTVFMGASAAVCTTTSCTVIAGVKGDRVSPLVSIERIRSGILLSAKVFDSSGNIVANVEGNKPHINKNFVSDWNRPDASSLRVIDNHDKQILYLKLLNKNSLYIEGEFNLPDEVRERADVHAQAQISKDTVTLNHMSFKSTCFGGRNVLLAFSDGQ